MARSPRAVYRDPRVRKAPALRERRVLRQPQHRFSLITRPYQIQPFMIAPVLPGETMKNLLMQVRAVTHPLDPATRLVGWWKEYFFFYVKHRDLDPDFASTLSDMVLSPGTVNMTPVQAGADRAWTYTAAGDVDFMFQCTMRIVEEYFRDEDELYDAAVLDGVPLAQIYGKGSNDWTDSLSLTSQKRTDRDVDLLDNDGQLTPQGFLDGMQHWQALRDAGLTQMDYQDFVNSYGGTTREAEESPILHRPELLRYSRNWQFPTNVVEPTTGVPATAVAWSVAERADKARMFNEPGFIVGLTLARPKIYLGKQKSAMVGGMSDIHSWLPPALQQHYETAFKEFDKTKGPLGGLYAENYWVDMRDLYVYGDQFANYALNGTKGSVALPTAANQKRYPASADINAWFKDVASNKILEDGIVHLGIAGHQRPTTPETHI